jgi:hypothetical protein
VNVIEAVVGKILYSMDVNKPTKIAGSKIVELNPETKDESAIKSG